MPDNFTNPVALNFASVPTLNVNYDVVWSFQYSLCGGANTTGGFTTFLYTAETPRLTGGGIGTGLGCGPSTNYTIASAGSSLSGVSGCFLAIGFDPTGSFALTGTGFTTGYSTPIANSVTIRTGSTFTFLSCLVLSALYTNFVLQSSAEVYNTLRLRLTNVSKTLKIDYKIGNNYSTISTITLPLSINNTSKVRVGVSYTTPVTASSQKCAFRLKDFHTHGSIIIPDTVNIPITPLV